MEKVSAWNFEQVVESLNGSEDFEICYVGNYCLEVSGWMGPSVIFAACFVEILFWWFVLWGGKRMLKSHWRTRLDNGRRRFDARHPDEGGKCK